MEQQETISTEDFINKVLGKQNPTEEQTPQQPTTEVQPQAQVTEPVQKVEPVIEQKQEQPVVVTDYSKRLKNLIQDGLIENFSITYGDQEVFLDDIADLTEEGYTQILQGWKTEKEKQNKEKYISVDGLDETTKKLIEIRKNGGDITEIIKENVTAIQNIQQLKDNIEDERVQIHIVGQDLQNKGISLPTIQAEIKSLVESGQLESRATELLEKDLSAHSQAIELKRIAETERVEKEKEDLKNLRKSLTAYYKEKNIPENLHKVLVDNATKLDQDKISNTDKLYFEAQKDPEKLAQINFFLNNPEGFKKWLTSKEVLNTKIESQKSLFTVNINQKKPVVNQSTADDYVNSVINKYQ